MPAIFEFCNSGTIVNVHFKRFQGEYVLMFSINFSVYFATVVLKLSIEPSSPFEVHCYV